MRTGLAHIQCNVQAANLPFYQGLMSFLGWDTIRSNEGTLGVTDKNDDHLWFIGAAKDVANDYDGPGMNHLAFSAKSQSDVDDAVTYLTEHGVTPLFETPRHRADFADGPDQTYYQVMFESPDRILLEVVYIGPKAD